MVLAPSSHGAFLPITAPSSQSPGDRDQGWAGLRPPQPPGCSPSSADDPSTCLLLVPHSVLQGLHLLQLVLVPFHLSSLWLQGLIQKQQFLFPIILLQGVGGREWVPGSYPSHQGTCGILLNTVLLASLPPHRVISFCSGIFLRTLLGGTVPLAIKPWLTRISSFCRCCTLSRSFFISSSLSSSLCFMDTAGVGRS